MPTDESAMQSGRSVAAPGRPPWHLGLFVLIAMLAGCGGDDADPVAPGVACPPGWNTSAFFQSASASQVAACLEAGEDINAKTADGRTPLHLAASNTDDPAVIRALLGAGARARARDVDDKTVLCLAAERNSTPAVIQALLEGGASVLDRCRSASDPLNAYPGDTPLHLAAGFNPNPEVAAVLIRAGANVNAPAGPHDETPLHYAARNENPAMAEMLVNAGAELNNRDGSGYTPLMWAVYVDNLSTTRFFLQVGAELSGALHIAAVQSRNVAIATALIDAGADLNRKTGEGQTPLHYAARYGGTPAVVEALLQAGADVNVKDDAGKTPLILAQESGKTTIAELLRRYGAT